MSAQLVELIECEERIGTGKTEDPHRIIKRWYAKDGQLVVEHDGWKSEDSQRFREISITVQPSGALNLHDAKGEWETGYTYRFWHPQMGGTP